MDHPQKPTVELNESSGLQSAKADGPGTFGVKVQVQGIQGRPYVVVNGQGNSSPPPVYPDAFFMDSSRQQYVSTMNGRGSCIQCPPLDYRSKRLVHGPYSEVPVATMNLPYSVFNYQRHPSLLGLYDPRSNSTNLQDSLKHSAHMGSPELNPFSKKSSLVFASNVTVKRARIPLPGSGTKRSEVQLNSGEPATECVPCRPSHIVCRLSVPYSGNDQRQSSHRVGRVRQRNQINPEERKRSHSAGAYNSGESSRTSPRVQGEGKDIKAEPGPSVKVLQNYNSPKLSTGGSIYDTDIRTLTAVQFEGQHNKSIMCPKSGQNIYGLERGNPSRYFQQNCDDSSPESEIQVTPDILKGQQELLDQPDEDAIKLVLFNYLKEGSGDVDESIRQKVKLLFEKIQMLRSSSLQNVEELSVSEAKIKVLLNRRVELEREVTELKQQLEKEMKNRESLSEGSKKSAVELKKMQDKLNKNKQEQVSLRLELTDMEKELQASMEKVLQMKRERERSHAETKSLQQQLSDIHDELDSAKSTEQGEKDNLLQELAKLRTEFQELQQVHEEQEEILCWKERELIALKGALEEEILAHANEVKTLQEHHKEEVQKQLEATEEARMSAAVVTQKKIAVEAEQRISRAQVQELNLEKELLLAEVNSLKTQITTLNNIIQQGKKQEKQLKEHLDKLMEEQQRLEEEFSEARQHEEDMCGANRALTRQLEDTQSELTRLNQEHQQLKERMKDEERQVEELIQCKREMEQERRKQDRGFDKLQEEIKAVLLGSERETQRLQDQVDKAREQSLKETSALRIQLHNTHSELEKHLQAAQETKKELCGLEAELAQCEAELEKAELKCKQLEMRVEELQECSKTTLDGRERQVQLMELQVTQLQEALAEECSSSDSLMQKMDTVKEQVELARAELLQERALKQDLECDKISLERQNKDLKSRVSYLEGSQKSSQDGLVSKLELRIQELEERLSEEERDRNTLQQSNRKLERKMKEITLQMNDEHLLLQNQRDQLTLRLKTLKRQLDESEEEIERLENSKKKLQRELDDQQEINEQLHNQFAALRSEFRHKKKTVLKSEDEEEGNERSE